MKISNDATSGTASVVDGAANTASMIAQSAGEPTYFPAAWFADNLTTGGFTDWYVPARFELEILYYYLKPTTEDNYTLGEGNNYAVPPRPDPYTAGSPAQTSVVSFQS
jgi:hypothetical protein